jgi:putative membrane protein
VRGFIIGTVVTAVAFYILVTLLPDMFAYSGGIPTLIVISIIFGIVNGLIGPIVKLLALPIRLATLGLVGFLINGGLLLLTAWLSDLVGFTLHVGDFPPDLLTIDTLIAAIVGAVVLSITSSVIRLVVKD